MIQGQRRRNKREAEKVLNMSMTGFLPYDIQDCFTSLSWGLELAALPMSDHLGIGQSEIRIHTNPGETRRSTHRA